MKDVAYPNVVRTEHGHATREMTFQALQALSGHGDPGKFGRMFPMLPGLEVGDDALFDLALAMRDPDPASADGENPNIPAGYTYLAQFVDHDITLDLTPLDVQQNDPLATHNFRSPALDLNSIYGPGPALAPFMYQRDAATRTIPKLLIGRATESPDLQGGTVPDLFADLPRNRLGRALIGDERNDENLLVAQTHLAFLKFHNACYDHARDRMQGASQDEVFAEAQRLCRWHYQWVVLFDLVERLTEPGLVARIKHDGRRFYRFKTTPYIPAEFSGAAYRLGHSMIRESYDHNRVFNDDAPFRATLAALFDFTGKSGVILGDDAATAPADVGLSGVPPQATLPSNWVIDWRRFYDLPDSDQVSVNASRRLDPFLTPALASLPGEVDRNAMLAFRNLRRGRPARPALGPGRGDHHGHRPACACRRRLRPRRRGGRGPWPAHEDAALVLHPQGSQSAPRRRPPRAGRQHHRGRDLPRPRPWRPRELPVAARGLDAGTAVGAGGHVHDARPSVLRGRDQPGRLTGWRVRP